MSGRGGTVPGGAGLAELAPVGLHRSVGGRLVYVNLRFLELTGREAMPAVWTEIVHPHDRPRVAAAWEEAVRDRAAFSAELPCLRPDGRVIWMLCRARPTGDGEHAGMLTDVVEPQSAEETQRLALERLREAQRIARVGSWELDLVTSKLTWSDEIFRLFGLEKTEFGATYEAFLHAIHPEDRDQVNAAYTRSLADRAPYEITHRLLLPSGEIRFVTERCRSDFDPDGKPLRSVGTVQDVTELKEAEDAVRRLNAELEDRVARRTSELREANEELRRSLDELRRTQALLVQSEKMAALGGLVAGVAHEINTPVGVGVTAASLLEQSVRELAAGFAAGRLTRQELADFIAKASDASGMTLSNLRRAADLIGSFKQLAVDRSDARRRVFDLERYLRDVVRALSPQMDRTRHRIEIDCPTGLSIHGEPGICSQIVTNLVTNSLVHAFDPGQDGTIRLSAAMDGDTLVLVYSDDGSGITAENLPRIFDPFFTTKRGQGGSGLGLHIVHNLVTDALGGTIACRSAPGQGTTFEIRVPGVVVEPAHRAEVASA